MLLPTLLVPTIAAFAHTLMWPADAGQSHILLSTASGMLAEAFVIGPSGSAAAHSAVLMVAVAVAPSFPIEFW